MRPFWRRALLLTLAFVLLPFQGMASATMLCCAFSVEHRLVAVPAADAQAVADAAAPCHRASSSAAQDPPAGEGCGACSACCLGAALLPGVAAVAVARVAGAPASPSPGPAAAFLTGGQERPPHCLP